MSTLTELQQLLHEKYDIAVDTIAPDALIQESELDSLAIAEFMFAVEDHYHITLPDDDPSIDTLAKLANLVDRLKAQQSAPSTSAPAAAPTAPATPATSSTIEE